MEFLTLRHNLVNLFLGRCSVVGEELSSGSWLQWCRQECSIQFLIEAVNAWERGLEGIGLVDVEDAGGQSRNETWTDSCDKWAGVFRVSGVGPDAGLDNGPSVIRSSTGCSAGCLWVRVPIRSLHSLATVLVKQGCQSDRPVYNILHSMYWVLKIGY